MTSLLLSIAAAAYGCDTAEQLAIDAAGFANAHSGHGSLDLPLLGAGPLTLLPQGKPDYS